MASNTKSLKLKKMTLFTAATPSVAPENNDFLSKIRGKSEWGKAKASEGRQHEEKNKASMSKLEDHLNHVMRERDFLSKELQLSKNECYLLKKKNKNLETELSKQRKKSQDKITDLELEVERLQKLICKRRDFEFQQEMEETNKHLRTTPTANKLTFVTRNAHKLHRENVLLKNRLITQGQYLAIKQRQEDKKDKKLKEKEKQCEKLKHSMSRLLPPEKLELITKCQWEMREQSKKIKTLMGQLNTFQQQAKDYESQNKELLDKVKSTRKLYLREKMENINLREALRNSEVMGVPGDKPVATQDPLCHTALPKQSGGTQGHTKTLTRNSTPISLRSNSGVKHKPDITRMGLPKPGQKLTLIPLTKQTH